MGMLQGRLPVRVELKTLTLEDLKRILSEKKFNILEQTTALLGAEGLTVEFTPWSVCMCVYVCMYI